jgi:FMN phosphatase YigB (HAD superfamily)
LSPDWSKIKVVIFDVDGTLYSQSRLRRKMFFSLVKHYARRPWKLKEMLVLHHFRAQREKMIHHPCTDLENAQYYWCAQKVDYPVELIRKVVDYWIFDFPISYLRQCTYPGIHAFFDTLRKHNIKRAIYSDYKAYKKLEAMGLEADLVVCSTDPQIDRLKPDPRGLLYIANQLNVKPGECLFIGDRYELDAACAIKAQMPYLIVDKKPSGVFDFYDKIEQELTLNLTKN